MTWIRTFLAAIASATGMLFALPVLLLGAPFWIVGALTHWLAAMLSPRVIRLPDLFQFDPTLGWRAKPNLDCHCLEERDDVFHVMTDEHGWPLGASLSESAMVVIGDSYAFGYSVDHEAAFFSVLDRQLRVKAIGVPGYNLVQELLLMGTLARELSGKLVVWFIYIGNDLRDNLKPEMNGYRTPFLRQTNCMGGWEILTSHLTPTRWTTSTNSPKRDFDAIMALHADTYFAQRAYSAFAHVLRDAHRLSDDARFRLVVMSIPYPQALSFADHTHGARMKTPVPSFDADFPDREIGRICQQYGIPFVALKDYLDRGDYRECDDHWTEQGHRRVAAVLADVYREHTIARISQSRVPSGRTP